MARRRLNLMHSLASVTLLLIIEGVAATWLSVVWSMHEASVGVILAAAVAGGLGIIVIAAEVVEEVRNSLHMLVLLSAVVFEFIVFFAFQHWYLSLVTPGSFLGLGLDPVSLLLHSTMIFVFGPLYPPLTFEGQALLLVNTFGALTLVFFVLQNIWQLRNGGVEAK
jgi:hypothetical protein